MRRTVTVTRERGQWLEGPMGIPVLVTLHPSALLRGDPAVALGHGHRIAVAFWDGAMEPGVDTPEDLERVRQHLGQTQKR